MFSSTRRELTPAILLLCLAAAGACGGSGGGSDATSATASGVVGGGYAPDLEKLARLHTNLLRVARLKLTARALGIRRLDLGPQGGYALFEETNQVDPRAVIRLVQHPDRDYRLEGALQLRISVETETDAEGF